MAVDPVIIHSEKVPRRADHVWRLNPLVPLDYYFNPVSHVFATKWHDQSMIALKQKVIEKSLKLASHHASFAKIVCLLFFRDALDPK